MSGKVTFVGPAPGAPDLIPLRGAAAIATADVVIWASSLVHPGVLEHARDDAEIVDSAELPMEGVLPYYERAAAQGLAVARVHSGDPALWGAIQEQLDRCAELFLDTEIVPGVSSFPRAPPGPRPRADHPRGGPVGDPDPPRRRQDADAAGGAGGRLRPAQDHDGAVPVGRPVRPAAGRAALRWL